jgi:hypothetical protein
MAKLRVFLKVTTETFVPVYQITRRHTPSTVLLEITPVIRSYVTQCILCVRIDPNCRLIHYRLLDTKLCVLAPLQRTL